MKQTNPYQTNPSQNLGQEENEEKKEGIRIDGFQQVLEMLRVADPAFRDSLLMRLNAQDPNLVAKLRLNLGI